MKIIFDIKIEIGIFQISILPISISPEHFQFWDQFVPKGGKYLIKIIFDIKIEIGMFQIQNVSNFKKF